MKINPGIIVDSTSHDAFYLSIYTIEKIPDGYIVHPVGSLDTDSYLIFERKLELILESMPEVIIFDMEHIHYINGRGLRIILKAIKEMKQRNRRVYLMNLQLPIKEMFDISNGLLSPWIFSY